MPWAAFVWLAQIKNVESGVCQLLCSAEKSPLLLFLCVAKVCTLDKSPVSDRGTRCCSQEGKDRLCSCSPPSLPPSQSVSWLPWHYLLPQAGRDPQHRLSELRTGTETPRSAAHVQQPPLPSSLPCRPLPTAPGPMEPQARGRGTSAEPGSATQLSRRLCLHVQINILEAEPKSRSQLLSGPCGSGYGAARAARHGRSLEQPPAWHGTEQMVRAAWPAAAASPGSSPHMMPTEATWASRAPAGRAGHRGTGGKAGAVAGGAGVSTERPPKSQRPSQHHHLLSRTLLPLQCEQQTGVAVGRI